LLTELLPDSYGQVDFAKNWDASENRKLCNSEAGLLFLSGRDSDHGEIGKTSFVAVVGANTLWAPGNLSCAGEPTDALGEKIVLLEIPNSDICWMEPQDISVPDLIELYAAIESRRQRNDLYFVTLNGRIERLSSIHTVQELKSRVTVPERE
jgi:hypothetical protein